jgi:diguanylate cyclase (GGDEF)-like protein/PAS domain S-box-containing protein
MQMVRISDNEKVNRLYLLSQKSMIGLIGFTVFVTYFLYSEIRTPIIVWGTALLLVALSRLLLVSFYRNHQEYFSPLRWYQIFLAANLVTAVLISLLGTVCLYHVHLTGQVFIIAALLGLSAGAMSSLFPDVRIALVYVSMIILPMIITLFVLGGDIHIVLASMLILYYVAQVVIAYNTYTQNSELEKKQQEVIATQERLLKNKETLEYFYTQAPIGIFSYDLQMKVTDCNQAFLSLFHLQRDELIGLDLNLLPDKSPIDVMKTALSNGVQYYVGSYCSTKGLEYWIEAKMFPIHNEYDQVIGGVTLIEDKTREHQAIERLRYLASHDPLTHLQNRRGFREYMEELTSDKRHEEHYSLLFYLDLNRFKYINDSLGHTFGDHLLQAVAQRLASIKETEDYNLTRLGGDEFVIVIPFVTNSLKEAEEKAKFYSKKIHNIFEDPFIIDSIRLYVKTSIGIVIIEPGFNNIEEIVRHADISMYQAKKHGSETISFYSDTLDTQRKETFALQQDLIYAMEHDLFELYLQPILNIGDDSVKAAEALIRWHHHEKGLLLPNDFIPIAIELGIITDIGWWVLKHVCMTIESWKAEGIWDLEYISININAKQLIKEGFIERFFHELDTYNVDTKDIKIEITETSLIDNFELTQQVIRQLQKRGITCVIDDFGTGYSSLSYLKKLSFSVLKIDKEFIFDLEEDEDNETLIRTIVEIARQFHYSVVVEGIETEKQKNIIKSIDKNVSYQGFLTSKPIPIKDFKKRFIKKKK